MDRIRALVFDHRRPLAAAFVALAVLTGLQSLQPDDPGSPVLVAARDLASGHVLTTADLTVVTIPRDVQPSHLLDRPAAEGRRIAGPVRAGEPITDRRVIEPHDLSGHGNDAVLTMVRLDDPAALAGVRVGDRVDVIATSADAIDTEPGTPPTRIVARAATIAIVPSREESSSDAAVIGVVTDRSDALDLAAAALQARLGVLIAS